MIIDSVGGLTVEALSLPAVLGVEVHLHGRLAWRVIEWNGRPAWLWVAP